MSPYTAELAAVLGATIIGGLLLVLILKKKPDWKEPFRWAVLGAIVFQLFRLLVEFVFG